MKRRLPEGAGLDNRPFAEAVEPLLDWYGKNARDLPWRHTRDPYEIWVSEIMLQQTRVAAVLGYYARFLEAFPTAADLAAGSEERLLSLWQGLGYYSRARNMKRAVEQISALGGFPQTYEAVRALPGIGDYTAGAIASAAFGIPRAAVDGNVLRVAARLADWREPVTDPASRRTVAETIEAVFPSGEDARVFNQAWMELGAVVCVPNGAPRCEACPLATLCLGRIRGTAESLPVREAKRPRRVEERTVFVLVRHGRTAVRKRPARGLLAGLWEFPNVPGNLDETAAAAVLSRWGLTASAWDSRLTAKHIFTHVEWHMTGYVLRAADSLTGSAVTGTGQDAVPDSMPDDAPDGVPDVVPDAVPDGMPYGEKGSDGDGGAEPQKTAGKYTNGADRAKTDGDGGAESFQWIGRRELDEYAIPSAFARFRETAAELLDRKNAGLEEIR